MVCIHALKIFPNKAPILSLKWCLGATEYKRERVYNMVLAVLTMLSYQAVFDISQLLHALTNVQQGHTYTAYVHII